MANFQTGLVLLAVFLTSAVCGRDVGRTGEVVEQTGSVVESDGSVANMSVVTDRECRLRQETTRNQDGSVSVIIKDFSTGKSVLLKSKEPDVCYVGDIPEDEMKLHDENCEDGRTGFEPGNKELKSSRVYEARGDADPKDLSDDLKDACKGRRLVVLVEVTAPDTVATRSVLREKRKCVTTVQEVCETVKLHCYKHCVRYGWWFGRNKCKREEERCDYGTQCKEKPSTVCFRDE